MTKEQIMPARTSAYDLAEHLTTLGYRLVADEDTSESDSRSVIWSDREVVGDLIGDTVGEIVWDSASAEQDYAARVLEEIHDENI